LSELIKEYGVHYICVLKKAFELKEKGVPIVLKEKVEDMSPEELEMWRRIAEECAREGKYIRRGKKTESLI